MKKSLIIFTFLLTFSYVNAQENKFAVKRASNAVSFISSEMDLTDEQTQFIEKTLYCQSILKLLGQSVAFIGARKFPFPGTKSCISAKPLRLLTTMACNNLTLTQAASKLCISLDTANKHMALAKKSLGTGSQANAVYIAVKQGLIDIE